MIGYGHRSFSTIVVFSEKGDVIPLPHDLESQQCQGINNMLYRDICGELVYQTATPVSATKTSIAGGMSSNTFGPRF